MEYPASVGTISLHRWASLRSELLWIYDGPMFTETMHQTADHSMGYWLWHFRKGGVVVRMDKSTLRARAGQWLVTPQSFISQDFSDDAEILSIHFHCQWPTGENLFAGKDGHVLESEAFPSLARCGYQLCELVQKHYPGARADFPFQCSEYAVFLTFQKYFMELLIEFSAALFQQGRRPARTGACDERLIQAVECLNECPLQEPFPEQKLRRETGLGRAHLDRLFMKEFNLTTKGHWDRLREEFAVRSLHSSSFSIKEIGYLIGFKQPSNFTKWFLQRLGMSPKDYREKGKSHWLQGN